MALLLILTPLTGLLALFVASQMFFSVSEFEQVVITRFGQFQRTVTAPGLHLKQPFVEAIHAIETRVLISHPVNAEYLTGDKKRLIVDPVSTWRVADPIRFFVTVHDETGARARLDDLISSELRRELAGEIAEDIISNKREAIMQTVTQRVRESSAAFGIEIIDVRIKRADLPQEVQASVFARMVAERKREASRYRAEGEERSRSVHAEAERERTILLATAQRQAQQLRGEGDAEATAIYAGALQQDAEFYAFQRSLQAYGTILKSDGTLVLSLDSDLFRYLTRARPEGGR